MPSVNDLKDSKFLTKEDADPAIAVTITGWREMDVSMESQPTKLKYVLDFREVEKPLVPNNTNGQRIALLSDKDEFDDWIGFQITLFNDKMVEFGGKIVGGIRVHVPQQDLPQGVTQVTARRHTGDGPPPPTDGDVAADEDGY